MKDIIRQAIVEFVKWFTTGQCDGRTVRARPAKRHFRAIFAQFWISSGNYLCISSATNQNFIVAFDLTHIARAVSTLLSPSTDRKLLFNPRIIEILLQE